MHFFSKRMSTYHYAPGAIHNDHHKEVSINLSSDDAAKFMKDFLAEDDPTEVSCNEKSPDYVVPIPRKGDYNGVREYIDERKTYDKEFKTFCLNHNRKELCALLTKEFGWLVDDNSLGKNISRNI